MSDTIREETINNIIETVFKAVEKNTQKEREQHTSERLMKLRIAQVEATGRITAAMINKHMIYILNSEDEEEELLINDQDMKKDIKETLDEILPN
jgi:hypothetical protein